MTPSTPVRQNRLAAETSPYLLQHADNPVDWYPWGPEALARARREDRPLLLSIGYAACHWCHVMERESFADESIAALMNAHFVCVKIDREERPDLDEIYMVATVALNGSGGWPMTVFLTPDQAPFFAGTYFPPTGRHGRPGFRELLTRIAELWRSDRAMVFDQARQLTAHVAAAARPSDPAAVSVDSIDSAVATLDQAFDATHGGFGGAPKFPPCAALSLLLRHHRRTQQHRSLTLVTRTLDAMKDGGIFDQLGGGFARYSTDARWLVPHFEKMLYDNAALARVYLEAFAVTANPEYARVARETLDWALREMQTPPGGFASSTDADSEGEEGKYFVFHPTDLAAILEPDAARAFGAYYDVTDAGNWEGKSVLHVPRPLAVVADELGVSADALAASLADSRARVRAARARRVPPATDDKVLVGWNGLMIGALAEGARVLGEERYRTAAARAARFLLEHLTRPDGGLYRTWRADKAHVPAFLEDYAYLGDGLLDLYEATADAAWFTAAARLATRLVADFGDSTLGDFYATARDHEALLVRPREGHDGALPSPNAVAARLLARLSWHLDRPELRARAVRAVRAYGEEIRRAPRAFATTLGVVDLLLEGPVELVIAGDLAAPERAELERRGGRRYLPNRVVAHALPDPTANVAGHPLLDGRAGDGPPTAYVCRASVCQAPVRDPAALSAALEEAERAGLTLRDTELAPPSVPGRASRAGTERYFARLPAAGTARELGRGGPWVAALGFGGYRVVEGSAAHRAALTAALSAGINLVDTSTNYGGGASEALVGQVIAERVSARALARDEIVVVSKVGYLQGTALEEARSRASAGDPWPEVVRYADDVWHCVHPAFLEAELTRALTRLGLETIDVLLLHNPEYFLLDAHRAGTGDTAATRATFYARIQAAFRHLEAEVARGRIGAYGVSSNTLVGAADDPTTTDVAQLHAAAVRAGGPQHSFRVVQMPLNLLEPGDGPAQAAIATAAQLGLGVLVNRPLNAIVGPALIRLVDLPPQPAQPPEIAPRLADVGALEAQFQEDFAPRITDRVAGRPPQALLDWGRQLSGVLDELVSLEQWLDIEEHAVRPHTRRVLDALDRIFVREARARWVTWRDAYAAQLEATLAALRERAAERSRERLDPVRSALSGTIPADRVGEPLARLAVWATCSVEGVTATLVGMRRTAYVEELLPVLQWPPLSAATDTIGATTAAGSPRPPRRIP